MLLLALCPRYTFSYTADIGAIYWRVFQIKKECIAAGQECANNTGCWCTTEAPYYQGGVRDHATDGPVPDSDPKNEFCSVRRISGCSRAGG